MKAMNEKISALMDDELERAEGMKLLGELRQDVVAREQWRRYHLYAAAMREELPSTLDVDFHERVAAELKKEPVQLSPASLPKDNSWRVPAIGLAVAASLLAVVVMVQKPFTGTEQASLSVAAVSPDAARRSDGQIIRINHNNEDVRERINRLLVEHNEYNPASDMTGMMPYARFVSFSPANGAAK